MMAVVVHGHEAARTGGAFKGREPAVDASRCVRRAGPGGAGGAGRSGLAGSRAGLLACLQACKAWGALARKRDAWCPCVIGFHSLGEFSSPGISRGIRSLLLAFGQGRVQALPAHACARVTRSL